MSIYARIFLPYVLALAAGSTGAWWLATTLMADTLTQRLEDQLGRAVDELASGRLPVSAELLGRLGALLGAEVVLVPAGSGPDGGTLPPLAATALHTLGRSPGGGAGHFRRANTTYAMAVRPLGTALDPRYRALAAASALTGIDQTSQRIARLLGLAALAGTLIIAWVAHLTARGITRPLREIGALAERLATGDLAARTQVHGARELVALGAAMAQMAERLAHYQVQIGARNRLSALGELAARVAHEVRNPLTAIKLHVELLAERCTSAADRRTLEAVLSEIRRLELVVASTLSLGRPGDAALVVGDLNALVAEVSTLLRPQLTHRHIALDCHLEALAPLPLDGDRLKQVLLNLVNNAADALPAGGRILIATAADPHDGAVLLAVEDSGPGLASASEGGGARSDKPHGLGLGLQISREIAAQHGGSLQAETAARLGGARFVLRLPGPANATPGRAEATPA